MKCDWVISVLVMTSDCELKYLDCGPTSALTLYSGSLFPHLTKEVFS